MTSSKDSLKDRYINGKNPNGHTLNRTSWYLHCSHRTLIIVEYLPLLIRVRAGLSDADEIIEQFTMAKHTVDFLLDSRILTRVE